MASTRSGFLGRAGFALGSSLMVSFGLGGLSDLVFELGGVITEPLPIFPPPELRGVPTPLPFITSAKLVASEVRLEPIAPELGASLVRPLIASVVAERIEAPVAPRPAGVVRVVTPDKPGARGKAPEVAEPPRPETVGDLAKPPRIVSTKKATNS